MHANRYRLSRLIKRGGAAEVFEGSIAGEHEFERRVAIKRLLPERGLDPSMLNGFVDEARIVSQLHHPNIVSVFDFGTMDDLPFLVLEFVDGLDLGAVLERSEAARRPIPEWLALHVTVEVAHALAYAHQAKERGGKWMQIVHRDVSPDNVLISNQADVKLTDFGIAVARRRIEATAVGVWKGKPAFMAPEQRVGDTVDARADLFSLGCVLHRMLAGASPVDPDAPIGELTLSRSLPADIEAIIRRATRLAPKERHQSADELAQACGQAMAGRAERDTRGALREWLQPLLGGTSAPARGAKKIGDDLLDLELVLGADSTPDPLPRYRSAIARKPAGLEGTVVHGYRIETEIGRGAWSKVYRAVHPVLKRDCAVKVMNAEALEDQKAMTRFRREAELLAQLDHPSVVRVFDFGALPDGRQFLSMELLRGETLRDSLRLPISPERAERIFRQLIEALQHAHRRGVVHRDLKPQNVMLTRLESGEEQVKVLDFGIARALFEVDGERLTRVDDVLGTPSYMAPEQVLAAAEVGPPADLYSLGVILYRMLGGKPPFTGSVPEVLDAHVNRAPAPLTTRTGLEALAMRLLEKDPAHRPTTEELLRALEEQRDGETQLSTRLRGERSSTDPRTVVPQPTATVRSSLPPLDPQTSILSERRRSLPPQARSSGAAPWLLVIGLMGLTGLGAIAIDRLLLAPSPVPAPRSEEPAVTAIPRAPDEPAKAAEPPDVPPPSPVAEPSPAPAPLEPAKAEPGKKRLRPEPPRAARPPAPSNPVPSLAVVAEPETLARQIAELSARAKSLRGAAPEGSDRAAELDAIRIDLSNEARAFDAGRSQRLANLRARIEALR